MRRILHLSDLHYGRADATLEDPLLEKIAELHPDLVVISGDFTQRARRRQFAAAARFVARIEAPVLSVPGNHDTPVDNLYRRFVTPFHRYQKYIDPELEPAVEDEEMSVVGVNTVNRFSWQRGHFSGRTVRRVCTAFADQGGKLKVVVVHHPLEHGPTVEKRLMRGASAALSALSGCGADVVLSGHLHTASAAPFTAAPGLLFVQAGTGLSTRLRGEKNNFNLLDVDGPRVSITTWAAEGRVFGPGESATYARGSNGWERVAGEAAFTARPRLAAR
ncbi:metallophosphoesterase family protein [Vannielia litorea]|uniref:3',5'-cyclic AMP phosphodiesterase CpdA n=1 Tax=Vannielia litorea TaxID=1217970 RepID=A0A1N6H722_9RHOB|nr:metallophosphoesterase [Vannielia litorea]SIO15584.1 3',5'-cyclic AMP phosphodiesterase CpdA [Vannielia litorea]